MSERDPGAPDVEIYEVGPRDGLQNEAEFVPTNSKLELIALLIASGRVFRARLGERQRAQRSI